MGRALYPIPMHPHLTSDLIAWALAFVAGLLAARIMHGRRDYPAMHLPPLYYAAALGGAIIGAYGFGSLNLLLSGHEQSVGRSIAGALAGGIVGAEIYKTFAGLRGSTGLAFVAAFSVGVAVGRVGCFLSGLEDYTYGTATSLPWGVDFGDGVSRHPVQLYEAFAMAIFAAAFFIGIWQKQKWAMRYGFYVMVLVYGAQRFAWEFLKPYEGLIFGLNIFHCLTAALCVYALIMMNMARDDNGHD